MRLRYAASIILLLFLIGIGSAVNETAYTATNSSSLLRTATNEAWATIIAGAGTSINQANGPTIGVTAGTTTNNVNINRRSEITFNTGVGNNNITGAIVSVYFDSAQTVTLGKPGYAIVKANPLNQNAVVISDYTRFDKNRLSNYLVPTTNLTLTAYNNFTLNAAGIAAINKYGITTFGMLNRWDIENSTANGGWSWGSGRAARDQHERAEQTYPPKLYITTEPYAGAPVASFTTDKTDGNSTLTVAFTDTSTNTPTSWQWGWGDGTANGTTQNPSHAFTTPGVYNVTLTATNAVGSGISSATRIGVCDPLGWYDALSTDSSSHYGNENAYFTWDTTNHVLISTTSNGPSAMTWYKGSPFYGGIYMLNWTPKAWNTPYHDDYYAEYLFGAQTQPSGEWYTSHADMYSVYMKKTFDEGYTAMIVAKVNTDGTHDQRSVNLSFNPVLNHIYNVTTVWTPGTSHTVKVYVDGVLTNDVDDPTPILHAGYFGFSVHGGSETTTWYDHLRINNNTGSAPSSNINLIVVLVNWWHQFFGLTGRM